MKRLKYSLFVLLVFTMSSVTFSLSEAQSDWTLYEDYHPLVMPGYSVGDWQNVVVAEAVGGQLTRTAVPGAHLTLFLQVTEATGGFSIVYASGPAGGEFEIQIDGATYGTYSSYAENPLYNREISHVTLPTGAYALRIVNGSGTFWFEAIRVNNGLLIQPQFDMPDESLTAAAALSGTTVDFTQDFEDDVYGPTEARPRVTATPYGRIGYIHEISPWIYQNITRVAYAYAENTVYGTYTSLQVEVTLGPEASSAYRVASVRSNPWTAILHYPWIPLVFNNQVWTEFLDVNGTVLYTSPVCQLIYLGNCEVVPLPQGPIEGVHSIRFHQRGMASHTYLAYIVAFDNILIKTEPECRLVAESPGLTNEARDMQAVVHPEFNHLLVHAGPTFNAMKVGGLDWDTTFHPEARFAIPDETDPSQIWFYTTASNENKGWILGWIKDDDGTEREYVLNHTDCTAPAPTEFTFPYDREAAATYATEQSYVNNTLDPRRFGQRRVSTYVPEAPFADIYYTFTEDTDSALFTSEVIWMGGMPFTRGTEAEDCSISNLANTDGWHYCPNNRSATTVWRDHVYVLGYYIDTPPGSGVTLRLNVFPDPEIPNDPNTIPASASADNGILREAGGVKGIPVFNGTALYFDGEDLKANRIFLSAKDGILDPNTYERFDAWARGSAPDSGYLRDIQAGDYLYINSGKRRADGELEEGTSAHGFIIAGWGPILDCADAISKEFGLDDSENRLYVTSTDAPAPDPATLSFYIPYIVDYSGPPANRVQHPVPRPFYCSKYTGGGSSFNDPHGWYFFRLPDEAKIIANRLYVTPQWYWPANAAR